MSMMDNIKAKAESLLHGKGFEGGKILTAVHDLIQQQGGIDGVIKKFQDQGLGATIQSWISSGANQSISADQIKSVFGQENIQKAADKVGIDSSSLTQKLTTALPTIIDKLSPNGQISASSFSFDNLMKVGSSFFSKDASNEPPQTPSQPH